MSINYVTYIVIASQKVMTPQQTIAKRARDCADTNLKRDLVRRLMHIPANNNGFFRQCRCGCTHVCGAIAIAGSNCPFGSTCAGALGHYDILPGSAIYILCEYICKHGGWRFRYSKRKMEQANEKRKMARTQRRQTTGV